MPTAGAFSVAAPCRAVARIPRPICSSAASSPFEAARQPARSAPPPRQAPSELPRSFHALQIASAPVRAHLTSPFRGRRLARPIAIVPALRWPCGYAEAAIPKTRSVDLQKEFGLSDQQSKNFGLYADMMLSSPTNVTAIKELDQIYVLHFADSLTLLPAIDELVPKSGILRVIDVGTGGGLPGVALAIARPDCSVTLLEATRKKTAFLDGVIAAGRLKNARTLWGRAEERGQEPEHREQYDAAVARAVAPLRTLAELCLPFVRPGGFFLAQKTAAAEASGEVAEAERALKLLGGTLREVRPLEVPGLERGSERDGRLLLVVEKTGRTPAAYPRLPGVPKSNPL